MEFDLLKFIYILAWMIAIVATIMSISGAGALFYYNHTIDGQLELLSMRIRKQGTPKFRWSVLFLAIAAWVAIYCF